MTKASKLLDKLAHASGSFPWNDLVTLLRQLHYEKQEMAGSRVRFYNHHTKNLLLLHRPHPESVIKGGALKAVKQTLKQEGLL